MASTAMLAAFRELTNAKQLDRADLLDLLRDGIHAALVRKYGPGVKFELNVDELQGLIRVARLRTVVEAVTRVTASARIRCDTAEGAITSFVRNQLESVLAADR